MRCGFFVRVLGWMRLLAFLISTRTTGQDAIRRPVVQHVIVNFAPEFIPRSCNCADPFYREELQKTSYIEH